VTVLRRGAASILLAACIIGGLAAAYPLSRGAYSFGVAMIALVVAGVVAFKRVATQRPGFSPRSAVVGAIIGIVVAGNILLRTEVGRPGAPRTIGAQAALVLLVGLAGASLAFLGSHVIITHTPKAPRPEGDA